jgi:hypothetical protein
MIKAAKEKDIIQLYNRAISGDHDSKKWFKDQFDENDECFLCLEPVGPDRNSGLLHDPRDCRMVLLVPICGECEKLDPQTRKIRELKMLQAMWPRSQFSLRKRA